MHLKGHYDVPAYPLMTASHAVSVCQYRSLQSCFLQFHPSRNTTLQLASAHRCCAHKGLAPFG